ncbi:MAG: hypothetical protein ABL908_18355 [Hyphomicrobium sp.]
MPTESRMIELRDAIVADFQAQFPEMREIEAHFGPFDLDELKAFSVRAPAVRVSLLGGPLTPVSTREQDVALQCAAYIVTKGTAQTKADVAALRIAEDLVTRLAARAFTRWSERATELRIDNHYSGAVREAGSIALFSVSWQTVVRIGKSTAGEATP